MNDTLLRLDNICPHEVNQDLPIEYDHAYYDMSEKWIIKMFDAHLKAYYLENGWSGNTSVAGNASMSFVNRTIVTFDDFHQVLESFVNITGEPKNELFDSFQAIVDSLDINQDVVVYRTGLLKDMIIFVAYLLLIVISLFGNLLVLFIILSQRQLRQQTTNKLIANLTVSDLFLTTFNIPLTIVRLLFDSWPLGLTFCYLGPLVQAMSVYVSTLTMVVIAIDRHQMLLGSMLLRRFTSSLARSWTLVLIWILSAIFSIPHFIFNRVVTKQTYTCVLRCEAKYPAEAATYSRGITIFQLLSQYLVPLTIISFCYSQIGVHIWKRASIGAMTSSQKNSYLQSKRRTLKMLILVVIVFAICWLPLNLYFFYLDFIPNSMYSKSIYTFCHWFGISSVCYNPFIYFWLNKQYQERAHAILGCCFRWRKRGGASTTTSMSSRCDNNNNNFGDNERVNGHARRASEKIVRAHKNRTTRTSSAGSFELHRLKTDKGRMCSPPTNKAENNNNPRLVVKYKTEVDRWGSVRPVPNGFEFEDLDQNEHTYFEELQSEAEEAEEEEEEDNVKELDNTLPAAQNVLTS